MSLRYSPSARGFFDDDLHREIPDDAVYVSPARHAELMEAQAQGAAIVPSPETGNPVIATLPDNADTRRTALVAQVKREAARRIEAVMPLHRQLNALRATLAGDAALDAAPFAMIDAIRTASDTLEAKINAADASELADMTIRDDANWQQEPD